MTRRLRRKVPPHLKTRRDHNSMSNHPNQPLWPDIPGYVLTEELYVGECSAVYRALADTDALAHPVARPVVIKFLRAPYPSFEALVRFRNQYIITKSLSVEGIVRPLTLAPWARSYALVMEDVGGMALSEYLQTCRPLSAGEVLRIGLQMADILHHLSLHRILHKDINPANILIHPDTHKIWLTDFSLASLLLKESQQLENPCALEGTLAYMAPEQTGRMNRGIDYRTDFYGLGVTLYELLTGEPPFQSDDPMVLIHSHIAREPIPPCEFSLSPNAVISPSLSDIVLKLIAKNAEKRYQSALGIKHDLRQCFDQWNETGRIVEFELGQRDLCDRFLIPEKLYGREAEVQILLDTFERVAQGSSELVLVTGCSGIGKTVVVNEIHKPITERKGYFIKGKFDQFNSNIPFSAFVHAFHSLVGQLLSESDCELANWRTKILTELGKNGQVLIEVLPELERIIGKQPTPPELFGNAAQNRLNLLFQKFISVFTTPAHPLVIFLDDLQWADSASLALLNLMMTNEGMSYLLVLGSYRDNEVLVAHPLMLTLEGIKKDQATIQTLTLKPLVTKHIHRLVADTLLCSTKIAAPLARLVYQRTQGNPFFTTQFLTALYEDNLVTFDSNVGYWQCDLSQIQQAILTDDVIEFMVRRLQKLPTATQTVLKLAACVGDRFDLETLAVVCERSPYAVAMDLWRSLQDGLVTPENNTYKFFQGKRHTVEDTVCDVSVGYRFVHDRIQQAAYSLITEEDKPSIHLKMGQLLLAQRSNQQPERNLFKIVRHLNKGIGLIDTNLQRQHLVKLNLEAGKQAKSSIAYAEAASYFQKGIQILGPQGWSTQYSLTLELHSELANIHFLKGEFETVNTIFTTTVPQVQNTADALPLYISHISSELAQRNIATSLDLGLQVLDTLDIRIPQELDQDDTQEKLHQVKAAFKSKTIQAFIELPQNRDTQFLLIQELLTLLVGHAFFYEPELLSLIVSKQVSLLMRHGNIPASASIYALYGMLLSGAQDFDSSFFAGEVALAMREAFPEKQFEMRVLNLVYSYITPWHDLLRNSLIPLKQGFAMGLEAGDIEYTGYGIHHYALLLYFSGVELTTVEHEISTHSKILKNYRQEGTLHAVQLLHQAVLNLITASDRPWQLEGDIFQESNHISYWQENTLGSFLAVLYITKLLLAVLFDKSTLSLEYAATANDFYRNLTGEFQLSHFHCYRALAYLGDLKSPSVKSPKVNGQIDQQQVDTLTQVAFDLESLKKFASHAPMNFQHQVDLVQAEHYRVLGQRLEAMEAYDRAIAGANDNQFTQEEALANELAAQFYLDWGKEKVAAGYMQEAYYGYARWGATAKTNDLKQRYPDLLQPILQKFESSNPIETLGRVATPNISLHSSTSSRSFSTSVNAHLDFTAVLKATQMLSEKMHIDDLLTQFVQLMLQNSGADKLVIMLPSIDNFWEVRAIATPEATQLSTEPLTESSNLPIQLIQYVKNTQQIIAIDNLYTALPIVDAYLQQYRPHSVLCLPILHQENLNGLLYLQNQSIAGVFNRDRITVINFLCSQAAIALENAQLYQTLEQRVEERTHALQASQKELERLNLKLEERVRDRTAQLAASEGRFKTLFDQAADATFLFGEQGCIDCNQAAVVLFKYSSKTDIIGLYPHQISPERQPDGQRSVDKFQFLIEEALQQSSLRFEWVHQRANGETFWAEVTLTLINYRGELIFHGVKRDISDRKQAEVKLRRTNEELVRATRMKDEFLANMSHELRTPLNAILGMTEGLQDKVFGGVNEQQLKALTTIEQSGSHLLELINEILDLAKIEAGNIELKYSRVSITHLCQSSLSFIRQQSLEKGIQLHLNIPWNLPDIQVDERRFRQVLINLLNNAVKFTPSDGDVTLRVALLPPNETRDKPYLSFAISDTGIGVSSEQLNRLFQPFVQIDSALNRQYEGTGLGLALVKRIVELHGGRVTITSEVGVGSCFAIELPYDTPYDAIAQNLPILEVVTAADFPSSDIKQPTEAPLVLLAEDNEANSVTISTYLQAKGYRILLATNGRSAIELAQSQVPDAILMDIQLPDMEGLNAIKHIRQLPRLPQIPIIALTAFAMEKDKNRCLAAGADKYLSKPVKLKQLALSLQELIICQSDNK